MEKLNCIIVDDVEIDRLMVQLYVKSFPKLNVAGVFSNPQEALEFLNNNQVDVVFLDIDMPKISGIELRKKVLEIPVCVFITSHPEYALESFELEALDYIIKPLQFARFSQTLKRIEEYMDIINKASMYEAIIGNGSIFIKEGTSETKINLSDIYYLEALKNYTIINTKNHQYRVLMNIGLLLKDKNFKTFTRIHRGFAIQKHFVDKITSTEIVLNNSKIIPIGRSYKENLNEIV